MKLSIIIVNYNVEYFLEQCLLSVEKALKTIQGEVVVVDNNSVDGSIEMLKSKFPWVALIENKENTGFSKANNQGINIAKGEYILLLNPDTLVEEDTFTKVISFMDTHPDAGGLGVKMVDGKGNFLPESKRGLPTPSAAFYKIFGISRLFPKSKRFSKYHLSYLDKDQTHEVEILSGAFMLMRKSALDKVGLLDETFFMYGEDIDLSYRLIKGGYKNYYFPETKIIHYKGESTKKSSVNYVFVFYNAMVIFAKKHFSSNNAKWFSFFINLAIYFRASVAVLKRLFDAAFIPFIDFLIVSFNLFVLSYFYQMYAHKIFEIDTIKYLLPFYGLIWVISVYFSGGYDKPIRFIKILKGCLIGTGLILMIYALFPKDIQFSRLMILLGFATSTLTYLVTRFVYTFLNLSKGSFKTGSSERFAIIGKKEECERIVNLLKQTQTNIEFYCFINSENTNDNFFLGNINQVEDILKANKIDELVFSTKDLSTQTIIETMISVNNIEIDFKIAPEDSSFLVGSNSIKSTGDLYMMEVNTINAPKNIRNKRSVDVVIAFLFLLISPIWILFGAKGIMLIKESFNVLIAKKTWIGYIKGYSYTSIRLPKIKPPVFAIDSTQNQEISDKLNIIYAKDYSIFTDFKLLIKNIKNQLK
ncbi:MAG: glycosyltransferase [Bacteroidia bacterium]